MTPVSVSVVLPCYNRAYCLPRSVGSVIAQNYPDWEIILVDDGSTDDTPLLAQHFSDLLKSRFRYARLERSGVSRARNLGIDMASGQWIAFQDSDDIWMPEKLGMQMERLSKAPHATFCFTDFFEFSDADYGNARHVTHGFIDDNIYPELLRIRSNIITCPSVVASRQRLLALGGFDPNMRICEDIDLWTRLARAGPVCMIEIPLVGVHVRQEAFFPYSAGLQGRHDLLARARKRDPHIASDFWQELRIELLSTYIDVALRRGDSAIADRLGAELVHKPSDPVDSLGVLARTLCPKA